MKGFAVVMCVWQRPELLPGTLASLAGQSDQGFDLFLINNNPALRDFVEDMAPYGATVLHNANRGGAFSRHRLAHDLAKHYRYFVFIDDDMTFPADYIAQVKHAALPDAVVGWRAWKFGATYWDKLPVEPGEAASFVIGCGMVAPSRIYQQDEVLSIPEGCENADDLWVSYYAGHCLGYRLTKGSFAGVDVVVDGKDTYTSLIQRKTDFLAVLRGRGWDV
jgi:glycosyltransferase involved in cell wall biosynthesis